MQKGNTILYVTFLIYHSTDCLLKSEILANKLFKKG